MTRFIQSPISFIKNVPRTNGGQNLLEDQMNSEKKLKRKELSLGLDSTNHVCTHTHVQTQKRKKQSQHTYFEKQNVPERVEMKKG